MDASEVTSLLNRLLVAPDEERRQLLNNVRPFLERQESRTQIKPILETSDLSVLFDVLNSSDNDVIDVGCKILSSLLELLDPSIVLIRYSSHLIRGLEHPNPEVKICVLKFCKNVAMSNCEEAKKIISLNETLTIDAAKCLFHETTGVAESASSFLSHLVVGGNPIIFYPSVLPFLAEAVEGGNAVVKMRVFELVVRVAKVSAEMTEKASGHGFLQRLCLEVQNGNDILSQLNAVEILSEFAESHHGFRFLEGQLVLDGMDQALIRVASDPFADLVMPGFIKFFGHICQQSPDNFGQRFTNFSRVLTASLTDDDRARQILAVETVAHIGMTARGRVYLREISMPTVQTIKRILDSGSDSEKTRMLSAYADLIRRTEDTSSEELGEYFFDLYVGLMDKLTSMIQLPFSDISTAAYTFFLKASLNKWSLKKFASHPGFIELLLNRDSAREKGPKELKYELIRNISSHPLNEKLVSENLRNRIKNYVREGPFYIDVQPEVAFEGADD